MPRLTKDQIIEINGVQFRRCAHPGCKELLPYFKRDLSKPPPRTRCPKHFREWRKRENRRQRQWRRETQYESSRYQLYAKDDRRLESIPEDFTAQNRVRGLWDGIESEQLKIAMLQGDFKKFMQLTEPG